MSQQPVDHPRLRQREKTTSRLVAPSNTEKPVTIDGRPGQARPPQALDALDRGGGAVVEHVEQDVRHAVIARDFAALTPEERTGTRNNYPAQRRNDTMATIAAIDAEKGAMTVTPDDGTTQDLDFRRVTDRHVRSGWVRTIHSAQGATAGRVMAHVKAFRANTVDTRSVYVAISRARSGAALYTDSRARLTEALGLRDGAQFGAIDETWDVPERGGGDRPLTVQYQTVSLLCLRPEITLMKSVRGWV